MLRVVENKQVAHARICGGSSGDPAAEIVVLSHPDRIQTGDDHEFRQMLRRRGVIGRGEFERTFPPWSKLGEAMSFVVAEIVALGHASSLSHCGLKAGPEPDKPDLQAYCGETETKCATF